MHTSFGLLAVFAVALASVACSSDPPPGIDAGPPASTGIIARDSGPGTITPPADSGTTSCKLLEKPSTLEPCNQCIEQNCCAELNACVQSTECVATDQCVSKCIDTGGGQQAVEQCTQGCYSQRPNAKAPFLAAQGCVAQKCASACGG